MFISCQNGELKDCECNKMVAKHLVHRYMTLVGIYSVKIMKKTACEELKRNLSWTAPIVLLLQTSFQGQMGLFQSYLQA